MSTAGSDRATNDKVHEGQSEQNMTTYNNRASYDTNNRKKQKFMIISDYQVVEQIGKGGFAEVFKVESIKQPGQFFAMKMSKKMPPHTNVADFERYSTYSFFMKEWGAYNSLSFGRRDENGVNVADFGIPKIYEKGILKMSSSGLYPYIVMQLLGPALSTFLKPGQGLPIHKFVKFGVQIIQSIQYIHSKTMVHRDIKPSNMCLSIGSEETRVYLVDMGFVKSAPSSLEYEGGEREDFVGTPDYASDNSLRGRLQGYKDDIEQLGYTMLELLLGDLPWSVAVPYGSKSGWSSRQLNQMADRKQEEIRRLKEAELIPQFFNQWMQHTDSLTVFQKPNYDYLIRLVQNLPTQTPIQNVFHKK
eukprot:TRINITY_DN9241_c0_g1_i7.p1 TRINITY_DN9241_c0_g1~~TRINITY_DN9241_c0_g1_i7.p1  ORF type:complete len:360 (+),score=41.32 TRINITY_DN9241_c0_g1_i7:160-1239(+)